MVSHQLMLQACYVPSELLAANDKYDMTGNLLGDKASTVVFDNSKLKSVVPGFKAEVKYRDGVKQVVDYILKHEECQVADPEFDLWCDHVVAVMQEASRKIAAITV